MAGSLGNEMQNETQVAQSGKVGAEPVNVLAVMRIHEDVALAAYNQQAIKAAESGEIVDNEEAHTLHEYLRNTQRARAAVAGLIELGIKASDHDYTFLSGTQWADMRAFRAALSAIRSEK